MDAQTAEQHQGVGSANAPGAIPNVAAVESRAALYLTRASTYARAIRKPPFPPETIHRLRTHLRRLQAYAEFMQRPAAVKRVAESVTGLSRLRSLYVFQGHLRRRGAPAEDLRRVNWAVREEERVVMSTGRPEAIRNVLAGLSLARLRRPIAFVAQRLWVLSQNHEDRLTGALRGLSAEATRKELHRLRLLVKSIRYQAEIALETGLGNPQKVAALKRLQRSLGDYCDRDQFRRMAKKLGLASRSEIKKEYRRYRDRARAAVRKLRSPEPTVGPHY
jgi:CHAD domain-containing protein